MHQTKLDEKNSKDTSEKNDAADNKTEEQAAAGSKRKETDSTTDDKEAQDDNKDRAKSRKTEDEKDDEQDDSSDQKQSGGSEADAEPVKLSGEQRKVDNKLKGDDVEINKGNSGSDDKKSSGSSGEVPWHVSEKGLIYFFYRPKVQSADKAEKNSTESLDDVQNTFMLLVPRASESDTAPAKSSKKESDEEDKRKPPNPTAYRLVSLGKKRMPSPEAALKVGQEPGGIGGRHSEAIWATIADIGADLNKVAEGMGEERYSTKTRGMFCLYVTDKDAQEQVLI